MSTLEVLNSLTENQRKEFEQDTKSAIDKIIQTGNLHPNKLHEVNINLRLEPDVFLNVTLKFIAQKNNKIRGIVSDVIKFDNVDQYLDAISKSKKMGESWTNLSNS
jgi:hypothetical protein